MGLKMSLFVFFTNGLWYHTNVKKNKKHIKHPPEVSIVEMPEHSDTKNICWPHWHPYGSMWESQRFRLKVEARDKGVALTKCAFSSSRYHYWRLHHHNQWLWVSASMEKQIQWSYPLPDIASYQFCSQTTHSWQDLRKCKQEHCTRSIPWGFTVIWSWELLFEGRLPPWWFIVR